MKRKARHYKTKAVNQILDERCRTIDKLAQYEEWCRDMHPELLKDLKKGLNAKQLREKYHARITAKQINTALSGPPKIAVSAIRDLVDRTEGRATEKKEMVHRLENLSHEQVQAMLLTELEELNLAKREK